MKHPFEDGEIVIIDNVDGMELLNNNNNNNFVAENNINNNNKKSINGTLHKVKTINSNSF